MPIQGMEEFKGEIPAEFFQQPAFVNPGLRPSQRESQVRDALGCYSVFSEGARAGGPDFTRRLGYGAPSARHPVVSTIMGVLARSALRFHPHLKHSACALGIHSLSLSRD